MSYKRIFRFFDRLEDRVRGWFSRRPLLYGVIGGLGVVLFWRGTWHTLDFIYEVKIAIDKGLPIDYTYAWDGPSSFIIGLIVVLITGLLVSNFIGNEIILSGLRGEKKLAEMAKKGEVKTKTGGIAKLQEELKKISQRLEDIEKKLK